ncbi:WxL domain-containing protein [Salinibacillus xinjiangensis]|uniref:WxL domain-containing protein n=1 Tax=Salinibacillus xinjiangensis TaxID=1229268 RepID=A0A6G1X438_9BACI|nr:WxL domain-containing protein [Salinibacillus xinjiangensis]MRG85666.1 hypothetical protein [Salinibacillus xinjiangensis]
MKKNTFGSINRLDKSFKGGNFNMKNLFKKIVINTALVGFVVGSFAGTSFAEVTSENNTTMQGGSLSVSVPSIGEFYDEEITDELGNTVKVINLDGTTRNIDTTLQPLTITDPTGTGDGWVVTMKADQFAHTTRVDEFLEEGSLKVATPTSLTEVDANSTDVTETNTTLLSTATAIDNTTGATLVTVQQGAGMGKYKLSFPTNALTLTLKPNDVYDGAYKTTVRVSIAPNI